MMTVADRHDPDLAPVTLYTVERAGAIVAAHCGLCRWTALDADAPHLAAREHLRTAHALYFEGAPPCPTSATTTADPSSARTSRSGRRATD